MSLVPNSRCVDDVFEFVGVLGSKCPSESELSIATEESIVFPDLEYSPEKPHTDDSVRFESPPFHCARFVIHSAFQAIFLSSTAILLATNVECIFHA